MSDCEKTGEENQSSIAEERKRKGKKAKNYRTFKK